jgi:hypothetical protein
MTAADYYAPKEATSSQPGAANAELETNLMLWSTFGLEI